ncbi:PREDICTED: LOW QUALITY PROTEIN: cation channel sperm-associated protein subunit gamma [Galeopterus variegatus]|uniref:LOW QUALITY PROTEIN: cation channel sperm-associated protein subunit gamma n=1 Tax=Galeopterus variegatus TaxID=482537 RepID=A0ABM0SGK3_GALVR|nr:PREDICTED: LOW QUALITY PROTEIN: cation channel sperm-associated protein subunit gamma [Galeopterus variegatus]
MERGEGSSHVVRCRVMSPAGPAWPRVRVLWALWALLAVLLAPWRLWAVDDVQECTWQVVLNKFETIGNNSASDRFFDQEPQDTVGNVFNMLVDAPIDPGEVRGPMKRTRGILNPYLTRLWTFRPTSSLQRYLGFPYYLKINYSCEGQLFNLMPQYFVNAPSRPLWHTVNQAPVLILGGIPNEKFILLTDTNFKDVSLVELSIDSCWGGSFYCPKAAFTATIYDAIATESTLFIRQNQLVYYFTGTYITLHESNHGSGRWVRVLANECIKMLCPVHFHGNGSEYIMALSVGKQEGYVYLGTITDGRVSFEMLPRRGSVCKELQVDSCSIVWAEFIPDNSQLLLLVESEYPNAKKNFQVVSYNPVSDELKILYNIPEFIPDARGLEFLMMLGTESYTSFPMVPKGMLYNPYNNMLFIWGNFLLQSFNEETFFYLADFPKELSIKYLVNSFRGDMAIVTETEEIWYLVEGSYQVHRLFPSRGWEVHVSLQGMHQSSLYAPNETMVTLFYEDNRLYQLVYLINGQQGRLVKRHVPVEELLMYQQHNSRYHVEQRGGHRVLSFPNLCPFTVISLRKLPNPQRYTRQERYRARPPLVLERSGFHHENSLAVYQGLVYYLLWLHSKYDKPYADPVHDPTWRWWKNNKQDEDYYFYLASNWRSAGGVHIDMASYEKIYDLKSEHELPERIFLDKGASYRFSIFVTAQGHSFRLQTNLGNPYQLSSQVDLGVVLADPDCLEAVVRQEILINRNSVLFSITLQDKRLCYDQGLSGHHLMKSSMMIKVVGSSGHCIQNTHRGARMQGNMMVPVFIGCPPGKRLAFDITYTLQYNRQQNKHYFDCIRVDPEMPCFLFRDLFYPFFLIQDLVTGDSGSFQGSYVLKVVGGGPTLDSIKDYSEEEIYHFNSPLDRCKVSDSPPGEDDMEGSAAGDLSGAGSGGSSGWGSGAGEEAEGDEDENMVYYFLEESTGYMEPALRCLSLLHTLVAFLCIIGYNCLKAPRWLCLENSPCYDAVPQSIFAPEFFFKVLVSNRDVDKSTYCNYELTFLLHIHGLPLSARRALFIVIVSASVSVGLVTLYIVFCLLWPIMVKAYNILRWKINNLVISDSYSTYLTPSGVFSMPSQRSFRINSKEAENRAEPKEILEKWLT